MSTGLRSRRIQIVVVVVIAIGAGVFLAPQVADAIDDEEYVAVIEMPELIDSSGAQMVEDELRDARQNDSVEAVVLEVDSGGGLPAESERIATAVDRTAQEMPVIAAIDTMGASGAYLSMVPADAIYVAPSSQAVGNVGVVSNIGPTPLEPDETTTGPNKAADDPETFRQEQQMLADLFLQSVLEYRGDEIELAPEEIAMGKPYLGVEAVENGFADDIGFLDDAIEDAAADASLDSYEVVRHSPEGATDPFTLLIQASEDGELVVEADRSFTSGLHLAVAPQVLDDLDANGHEFVHSSEPLPDEFGGETDA